MGEITNGGVKIVRQKDSRTWQGPRLMPTVFKEIFIVPDTKEIYFFRTFEDTTYEDFEHLLDKQQELAKANQEVKEASFQLNEDHKKEKKKAAEEFKKQIKLNMDEALKAAKTPKLEVSEAYSKAVEKAEKAFISCDEAMEKATGGNFKNLAEGTAAPVEILSLTRNRPILLAADKFEEIKTKAKIVESGNDWFPAGSTEDNDFMGLVRSLKNSAGEYHRRTIVSAFKKLNGSIKLVNWPSSPGTEGNASLGSEKLAEILKDINDNATKSTGKDILLSNAIKERLDDTKRSRQFTVDDAEYVITSLRDLYGKRNEEAPVDPESVQFVTENLGQVQDTYNEDPSSTYFTVPLLTHSKKGEGKRKELLSKMNTIGLPTKMWDASASAKIMRYAATAGGSASCDLNKGLVNYNLKAEAKLDLVEAKADVNCYLPSDKGTHLCFSAKVRKKVATYNKAEKIEKDDSSFFHDSSFVAACTAQGLLINLSEAEQRIINNNSSAILSGISKKDRGYVSLVGKADKSGSNSYNNELSLHRALAAYSFIYKDVDAWFYFFKKKIWGSSEADYMLKILCADKNAFDQLKKELNPPFLNIPSFLSSDMLFPKETDFLSFGFSSYPTDKYNEYFQRIPEGKMEHFGSAHSTYDSSNFNWEKILKSRIAAYFKLVHSSIEQAEGIGPIHTEDLLITRANIFAVGESQASPFSPNKSASDRTVDVLCHTIASVQEDVVDGTLDFGHIRILFKGYLSAWAGVEASVTAGLEVKMDQLMLLKGLQPAELTQEEKKEVGAGAAGGTKKVEKGSEAEQGASLSTAASAFAGAKAEAGVKALLEWMKPEEQKFTHLAEAGYSLSGMAGAGVSFDFKVGFDTYSGKFVCKMKAEATLGVGCGGAFSFAVSANALIDFVKLIYQKLEDVDFSFLDIFETDQEGGLVDVYKLYSQTLLELIKSGRVMGSLGMLVAGAIAVQMAPVIALGNILVDKWSDPSEEEEKKGLEELANCINERSEILEYLNPETKGRILYLLSKYSLSLWWEDVLDLDWNHENEVLALRLIEKGIKTKRDYQETISHMVDFEVASHRLKNRDEQKPQVSVAKSIDDGKTKAEIALKQSRIQMGEKWLKDTLFSDQDDWIKFDQLTKLYK